MSKCIRRGRRLYNRSELKLDLIQGKMDCKHCFKHVQDQTRGVHQGTLLSELNNS